METIRCDGDTITLLDQTRLPHDVVELVIDNVADLVAAIRRLSVRGAPAIGVAGAYGVAMAARLFDPTSAAFEAAVRDIRAVRPTAVNLAYAVDRVAPIARLDPAAALVEAHAIRDQELASSIAMGELGADLATELVERSTIKVITVCNTGGLAAVERGTALAVIQTLHERGVLGEAVAMETRPLLQGARLTTWELQRMGAPYRLIVDSAAPFLLSRGAADIAIFGADRIAANGDVANKIGSFSLSLGAQYARVPVVVVAPESTVDMSTATGAVIEIEDRGSAEVASVHGVPIAAEGSEAMNPAFDITPASMITAIVTEKRVVRLAAGERL